MQLPAIDRTPNAHPASADSVPLGAHRVIPVAPVNPSVGPSPSVAPGVVDMVNPALKGLAGEAMAGVPSETGHKAAHADLVQKSWTLRQPAIERVEVPAPKPISQVLMDHLKTVWTASASAVHIEQVGKHLIATQVPPPAEAPGVLAKEVLVYAPHKIRKPENI